MPDNIVGLIDIALAIKLASTALLVVVATGFAARFGPFFGAMIAALPISAGPSYLFIAMENDPAFVAQSALTSIAINPLTVMFLVVGAAVVRRSGIVAALAAGLGIWALGAFVIARVPMTLAAASAVNAVVIVVAVLVSRRWLGDVAGQSIKRGWVDIPLRVLAVVTVVGSAVLVGRAIGAQAAGIVALVPVVWISMAVIIYMRQGGLVCSAVLANGIAPMTGFWLGLVTIHVLAVPQGSTVALLSALGVSVGFTLGLAVLRPYIPIFNATRAQGE